MGKYLGILDIWTCSRQTLIIGLYLHWEQNSRLKTIFIQTFEGTGSSSSLLGVVVRSLEPFWFFFSLWKMSNLVFLSILEFQPSAYIWVCVHPSWRQWALSVWKLAFCRICWVFPVWLPPLYFLCPLLLEPLVFCCWISWSGLLLIWLCFWLPSLCLLALISLVFLPLDLPSLLLFLSQPTYL